MIDQFKTLFTIRYTSDFNVKKTDDSYKQGELSGCTQGFSHKNHLVKSTTYSERYPHKVNISQTARRLHPMGLPLRYMQFQSGSFRTARVWCVIQVKDIPAERRFKVSVIW